MAGVNLGQAFASGGLGSYQNTGFNATSGAPLPNIGTPPPTPTPTPTRVDPYARFGGTTAYNNLVSGFDAQKAGIHSSAGAAADNAGIGLGGSIRDFVDSMRSGQRNIDSRAVNNFLGRQQSMSGILGMVGRGIRSGGVMLGNKNAGDSSAAGAISKAYGDIGRREATGVGQKFELENRGIQEAQTGFEEQRASGTLRINESKAQVVNNIVNEGRDALARLDADMINADLPGRIAIEQEKASIKSMVLSKLSQYDQQLSQGSNSVRATSMEARRAEAGELANLGQAAEGDYQYTEQVPLQLQGTGPFPSELPIFTRRPDDER